MRLTAAMAVLCGLTGCSLCPDGYEPASNPGTYGFVKCVEEREE